LRGRAILRRHRPIVAQDNRLRSDWTDDPAKRFAGEQRAWNQPLFEAQPVSKLKRIYAAGRPSAWI
jgi:hypothetical protein